MARAAGGRPSSSTAAWRRQPDRGARSDPSGSRSLPRNFGFQCADTLRADRVDRSGQFLDAARQPLKVLDADPIMLRIARLHIGFLEFFELRLIGAALARPSIDQPPVELLRLAAQEADIVNVRCVEGHDQQNAIVEPFGRLVQVE